MSAEREILVHISRTLERIEKLLMPTSFPTPERECSGSLDEADASKPGERPLDRELRLLKAERAAGDRLLAERSRS
jgi:hypothetical protein